MKFYEFEIAYKGDGVEQLENLGIDSHADTYWDLGSIDLTQVQSFYKSRNDSDSDWTETSVTLTSGEAFTIRIHYDDFKKLIQKEIAK